MDESRPATAEPEQPAAEEEDPPHERRRLHVPTSVLVTVLVAALSVWVAPAFTRQWEDRKQARQLQAQLAEDIALATASTVNRIEAAGASSEKEQRAIVAQWAIAHSRIEAKLRVYFPQDLREDWSNFGSVIQLGALIARESRQSNGDTKNYLIKKYFESLHFYVGRITGIRESVENLTRAEIGLSHRVARSQAPPGVQLREASVRNLLLGVQDVADYFTDELMAADPEVFSTTRRDLLRDLLP